MLQVAGGPPRTRVGMDWFRSSWTSANSIVLMGALLCAIPKVDALGPIRSGSTNPAIHNPDLNST